MKRVVSVSIGSSKRDKVIEIELMGEQVRLERIGTNGDMRRAAAIYQELDGKVDALGVGGAVLGLMIGERWYSLPNIRSLVAGVHKTPLVDGTGLKMTLECDAAAAVENCISSGRLERRAFIPSGVDRYGLTASFVNAGYESVIGDLMFTMGVPIPLHSLASLDRMGRILIPVVGRLPFSWLYPTGEAQEQRKPRWQKYFDWCTVIAGDCHFITHSMPDRLDGKVVVTNTTTVEDRRLFREAGVKLLVTTTPVIDGRSFGTNMIEAALVAVLGRTEPVDYAHPGDYYQQMSDVVRQLNLTPQVIEL